MCFVLLDKSTKILFTNTGRPRRQHYSTLRLKASSGREGLGGKGREVRKLVAYGSHARIQVNVTWPLQYRNLKRTKVRECKSAKFLRVQTFLRLQSHTVSSSHVVSFHLYFFRLGLKLR